MEMPTERPKGRHTRGSSKSPPSTAPNPIAEHVSAENRPNLQREAHIRREPPKIRSRRALARERSPKLTFEAPSPVVRVLHIH